MFLAVYPQHLFIPLRAASGTEMWIALFFRHSEMLEQCSTDEVKIDDNMSELETIESFIEYLRTLDSANSSFWKHVYSRIGLPFPADTNDSVNVDNNRVVQQEAGAGFISGWFRRVTSTFGGTTQKLSAENHIAELAQKKKDLKLLKDPETICSFGQMTYDGDGVEQSFVEAAAWYRIAAVAGNARAQHNLSLMYENGEGVSIDDAEAIRWCRAAANQGHAGSQNNLGVRYETGAGVPKDISEALYWYEKAAANGDTNALENITRIRRSNK